MKFFTSVFLEKINNPNLGDLLGTVVVLSASVSVQPRESDRLEPDAAGFAPALVAGKVIGPHGFLDVPTQRRPGVALVKMFSETHLATKPAVFFLCHFKNRLVLTLAISVFTGALANLFAPLFNLGAKAGTLVAHIFANAEYIPYLILLSTCRCAWVLAICREMTHKQEKVLQKRRKRVPVAAVDLFCGAGGLTRGLLDAGIDVVAGYDIDSKCKYAYQKNNEPAVFKQENVADLKGVRLASLYPPSSFRVLVGCAPCQPFSKYTQGVDSSSDEKWGLLYHFGRLVEELKPDVLSMENVTELQRHEVYADFVATLERLHYYISRHEVYCPDYGIPQRRTRLVLFASKLGPICVIPPTHQPQNHPNVKSAIGSLAALNAGEFNAVDLLHRTSSLSQKNLKRIRHSTPGGTWRNWPKNLVAKCHRKKRGKTYPSVYGRMQWEKPSPTITTQFFGFGNGRFGHPEQDRGLSLREGAILQSFPPNYQFIEPNGEYSFKTIGRMIGNAVPVRLGEVVGKTIQKHLLKYAK